MRDPWRLSPNNTKGQDTDLPSFNLTMHIPNGSFREHIISSHVNCIQTKCGSGSITRWQELSFDGFICQIL